LDECTFSVTPLVDDYYSELLDGADLEYNILNEPVLIPEVICYFDNGNPADDEDYTHCRMFIDVIEYLTDQLIPGALVDSTFFESANNPVTLTTNRYNYLTIAQKSDIKRPDSTNPATVGMMSFNQVMAICRCMNLYWDLVLVAGVLTVRVEHVSFWPLTAGPDIRTQKIARGTNKYRYLNETMPKYEKFSWMEAGNVDFIGEPIWYNSDCVNQDSESNTVDHNFASVTTDLEYIRDCVADSDSEPLISDDGWVLLANENRTGVLYIWFNESIYYLGSYTYANADLSWFYLHFLFWQHDRQLITGYMNGLAETFTTARKVKQQECSIATCADFDPMEYLTTELGETYFGGEKARIGKAMIRPYGQIDLTLLYGPDDNANPGYTYTNRLHVWGVNGVNQTTVYGMTILNNTIQLDFVFNLVIKDAIGGTCTTADQTLTILANARYGSKVVAWCDPGGGAPLCIDLANEVSMTGGWSVDDITSNLELCP
jgi:hypothetical protein